MMKHMADNAKNYSPQLNDSAFDIVAVAASAGGLNAVSEILSTLPAKFSAAIAIVQHLSARYPSVMAEILNRKTVLKVKQAEEGDNLAPGTVYISPPDRHLLVNDGTISLSYAESVRFLRPCADLLFESVALNYKQRAIALVLSGTGNDGSIGIGYIKKMGGTVIAQDKKTAEFFGMPSAAIQTGNVDLILPLNEISNVLMTLVMGNA
jgi:two-component system, chemotaxis family, protein-glutamate methylesterase/glutaminase